MLTLNPVVEVQNSLNDTTQTVPYDRLDIDSVTFTQPDTIRGEGTITSSTVPTAVRRQVRLLVNTQAGAGSLLLEVINANVIVNLGLTTAQENGGRAYITQSVDDVENFLLQSGALTGSHASTTE